MSSDIFLDNFEKFCLLHKLIEPGDKVLIGCSGGADSMALLNSLNHFRSKYHLTLLVAHVNYNLRGEESKEDEQFVINYCFEHNISLVVKHVKNMESGNLENVAREIRMEYFNQLLKLYKFHKIALGHNKEDQAETILLRLIRGAAFNGLKGILPQNNNIIHPLLQTKRQNIEEYLVANNFGWRTDSSNKETMYNRNKIRHKIIPWIEENINSKVVEKLYNTSVIFRETDIVMKDIAKRKIAQATLRKHKYGISLSLNVIKKIKSVIRFYIYRDVYRQISGTEKDFYQNNFNEIESIIFATGSKQIMLAHKVIVLKEYDNLIFMQKGAFVVSDINNQRVISGIRARFSFENYRIYMSKLKIIPLKKNQFEDKSVAYLDYDKVIFPLTLRHRQEGDKFKPIGMNGNKKLKDFFIDEKVPKFERDNVIVFSDSEKIIWIGGKRIDSRVSITKRTKHILMIRMEEITFHKSRHAERVKKKKRYSI